jgi:hypothetical protein
MKTKPDVQWAKDDTLPVARLALTNENGVAVDLSTATAVVFRMWRYLDDPKIEAAADIVAPATDGLVDYTPAVGDTDEPGRFRARVIVTFPNGQVSYPNGEPFEVLITDTRDSAAP